MKVREFIKKPKFLLKGINTYLPNFLSFLLPTHQPQFSGQGVRTHKNNFNSSEEQALSCYSSWMRTLVALDEQGISGPFLSVGEIGPGDSLGVGLCALLTGTERYLPMDIVSTAHSLGYSNSEILEELIILINAKTPIPDEKIFPKNYPVLSSYKFPSHILTNSLLSKTMNNKRISYLRRLVKSFNTENPRGGEIQYLVPWTSKNIVKKNHDSMDLIVSFAAMEHVDDVKGAYESQYKLLKKRGLICHSIDFKSHDTAGQWNGHWTYGRLAWKLVRGKSVYLINRWPFSWHQNEIDKFFSIQFSQKKNRNSPYDLKDLSSEFKIISSSDLTISDAFIVAKKVD